MFLPSITRSVGTSAPASFVKVGSRSIAVMSSAFSFPAGMLPGQRTTVASRMPPSKVLPFLPRSGPVSVAVEYLIDDADVPAFKELMFERRRIRRRDGARQWTLLRNLEQVNQWIERFELPTWADYVRFHARTTQEDGRVGERIRALHQGEGVPRVRRMLVREPVESKESVDGPVDV